jgi:AraC-like DNA-binding protein
MTAMVRASGLRGYVTLMRQLGADPLPALRRHGIAPESLQDEDALIPARAVMQLLEASAALTGCPDFGLRLAQHQDISVLGPLAVAMQNAPTVARALDYCIRYLFMHAPGLALSVHEHSPFAKNSVELRIELSLERLPAQRQTIDLCLADLHQMLKLLAGDRYRLRALSLPHEALAPRSVYSRFFGAPIHFAQAHAGLHLARSTLDVHLRSINESLRQIAVDYLSRLEAPGQSLTSRVRQRLRHTLGSAGGKKTDIADLLGMHPRTMQRHLEAEGTTFETLREEVRKEVASRYLRETQIPLKQLAGVLGLSEESALARSCRRWFGMPPSRLRQQEAVAQGRAS